MKDKLVAAAEVVERAGDEICDIIKDMVKEHTPACRFEFVVYYPIGVHVTFKVFVKEE